MIVPNVDYLSATIDIKDYDKKMKAMIVYLSEMKNTAKLNSGEGFGSPTAVHLLSKDKESKWVDFEILANGTRGYAFILHNDAFEIKVAQYRSKNKELYPIAIRIKSEILWSLGVKAAWSELCHIIESSFGEIIEAKISRLDLACHVDTIQYSLMHLTRFQGHYEMENIYRENRQVTGLNFGSPKTKKIYVRIYDKTNELKKKRNKNWFYEIWNKHDVIDRVWNVEFELHREFFKEIGVNTVQETLDQLKSIWRYCTKDHLHLKVADKTRIENSDTDPLWRDIQAAYDDFDGVSLIKRDRQLSDNAEALVPAISGYLTSYASKLGMVDFDEIVDEIKARSLDYIESRKESTVQEEVVKKAKLIYRT